MPVKAFRIESPRSVRVRQAAAVVTTSRYELVTYESYTAAVVFVDGLNTGELVANAHEFFAINTQGAMVTNTQKN